METDILGGVQLGYKTILVLSGGTRREDLKRYAYRPDLIVDRSPISTPSHSKASSGQCRPPATLLSLITIRLIVPGASLPSPGRSDNFLRNGEEPSRDPSAREVIPCRRRGWFAVGLSLLHGYGTESEPCALVS